MNTQFVPLDLSKITNHKLIYDILPEPTENFGLDNICILSKNFSGGKNVVTNGVDFSFSIDKFDNVYCDNQEIAVNRKAKAIHILGFSYWGDTYEKFRVIANDKTEEEINVVLPDWSHSVSDVPRNMQIIPFGDKVKAGEVFLSSGRLIHMINLHHFTYRFQKDKEVSKIIFPDNMFMHIFAITLEE